MHALITGAGQIGRALTTHLDSFGHTCTLLRRSSSPVPGARVVTGDAGDPALLRSLNQPAFDAIFHCIHTSYTEQAWRRELPSRERAIMDLAAELDIPVIFPESVYAFGVSARDLHEGTAVQPCSPLGQVRAELLEQRAGHRATTISVVAADLCGPTAHRAASIPTLSVIAPTARGARGWLLGDADLPHSITYLPDLAHAMTYCAHHREKIAPAGTAVVHCPCPAPESMRQLAQRVAAYAGTTPRLSTVPSWLVRVAGHAHPVARELNNQRYLWREPAVLRPGRLGITASSWPEIIAGSLS
ncbi:NAD dependent epimerase/dehydratase family protein [Corynebacterium ciconiae DSM 44920]|uniref:NAD-dependent epimerase/dehydratase family protein n=1 Tax=Corynebacterium ciconiae TaxID=227319 RepID=UPI00035C2E8A|nr:NAD-dependent epimerase/dehydratase family protein [Corynebacterium ciconiae]WKD61975.1 NAD dependent epimerase/dehydratase family protein [Corynebacterium ciconiae DSM 44920]